MDDLKFAVFENSVTTDGPIELSTETFRDNSLAVAKHFGRKEVWFGQQIPWLKGHIGNLGPLWFLSVNHTIVCLDDFERRGEDLSVRDVLGLVSHLREAKACKVVLIMNEKDLASDAKEEFNKYFE